MTEGGKSRVVYKIVKSMLRALEALFGLLLMLVVMQYNVGYLVSAVIGVFIGSLLFDGDSVDDIKKENKRHSEHTCSKKIERINE